jgi:hypothetical protein
MAEKKLTEEEVMEYIKEHPEMVSKMFSLGEMPCEDMGQVSEKRASRSPFDLGHIGLPPLGIGACIAEKSPESPARHIVQLVAGMGGVYVLCSDNTVWGFSGSYWYKLPEVPVEE